MLTACLALLCLALIVLVGLENARRLVPLAVLFAFVLLVAGLRGFSLRRRIGRYLAAESFKGKVHVIDSKALSSGQGLLVLKAADLRDEGKSAKEIVLEIEELRERVNTSFIPDSLDYLHKGGRVSGMVSLAANVFKIHPLILMNDGQLVPGKKYRGKMSVIIQQYIDDLKEMYPDYDKARCFITHSSAEQELVDVAKAKVQETFEFDEIIETVAGSIITSHCGKGTLGVLFIYNK